MLTTRLCGSEEMKGSTECAVALLEKGCVVALVEKGLLMNMETFLDFYCVKK